jgi:hypothetical protein
VAEPEVNKVIIESDVASQSKRAHFFIFEKSWVKISACSPTILGFSWFSSVLPAKWRDGTAALSQLVALLLLTHVPPSAPGQFYHTTILLGDTWSDVSDGEIGNLSSVAITQMAASSCEQQSAAPTQSRTWQGLLLPFLALSCVV